MTTPELKARLIEQIGGIIDRHIAPIFKSGAKFTVLARSPGFDDADVVVTSDDDAGVLAIVGRQFTPPAATPAAPGEVMQEFASQARANPGVAIAVPASVAGEFRAALSNPAPVAAPAQSEVEALARLNATLGLTEADATIAMSNANVRIRRLMAEAAPAPASEAVAKWIDDPHDIEQGMMLNPAWLKLHGLTAQEAVATPTPGDSAAAPVQQAGADDSDMVNAAYCLHKYRQGTDNGIAFNRGARWMRAALKGEQPVEPSCGERGEV